MSYSVASTRVPFRSTISRNLTIRVRDAPPIMGWKPSTEFVSIRARLGNDRQLATDGGLGAGVAISNENSRAHSWLHVNWSRRVTENAWL